MVLGGNPNLKGMVDYGKRLSIITRDLFQVCVERVFVVCCGMVCVHMQCVRICSKHDNSCDLPSSQTVYNRVAQGMLHDDRIVLAILLCRIHLRGVPE